MTENVELMDALPHAEPEPEQPQPEKTKIDQFQDLLSQYPDITTAKSHIKEIAKQLDCAPSLGYKAVKRIEKFGAPKHKAKEPTVKIPEAETEQIEVPEEEVPEEEAEEAVGKIAAKLMEGEFEPEDIQALFDLINEWLPADYKPPKNSSQLLGKLGAKPVNRLIAKYIDENVDAYFFAVCIIIAYAPIAIKYVLAKRKGA